MRKEFYEKAQSAKNFQYETNIYKEILVVFFWYYYASTKGHGNIKGLDAKIGQPSRNAYKL